LVPARLPTLNFKQYYKCAGIKTSRPTSYNQTETNDCHKM